MNNITIPYNDVFFYGLTMKSRDIGDVRGDVFSNILMRYLTSLQPVSNRLYRVADNAKYEYSYSFVPSKPINWRVIKNRRVIEDIEQLSDGKYCLNYYDDNGFDLKRIIYNNQHKWVKTNYYNSIYGETLVCSLVPKELNGETVILQYITGNPYPVTLYCCPIPSNSEVLQKILSRVPEPEVTALTNYGLMYFASEETLKFYNQVLEEEERQYLEVHKPKVYNTEEDVSGGFCFDVSSFDTTKNQESSFDLISADELTEDGFDLVTEVSDTALSDTESTEENTEETDISISLDDQGVYSVDKDISEAIRIISESTNLDIDETLVFSPESNAEDNEDVEDVEDVEDIDEVSVEFENTADDELSSEVIPAINDAESSNFEINPEEIVGFEDNEDAFEIEDDIEAPILIEDEKSETYDNGLELLNMDDDAIDDYVSTLIDSILLDAKSTATEFMLDKGEAFSENNASVSEDAVNVSDNYITDNKADSLIESNGLEYYYYGSLDSENKRSGRGKTVMADGKTAYEGDYVNDMRDGVGSFYFKDGTLCYWGDWSKNRREGFGLGISSETGIAHVGAWENNKPVGIGARFDKNGNFMYIDSSCEKINGGVRVTGLTENSLLVEVWDEKTLKILKKEIFIEDLFK